MFSKTLICLALVCAFLGASNASEVKVDTNLCSDACPDNYEPVCGTDGAFFQEFDNECQMNAHNCHMERSLIKPFAATHLDMCRTELVSSLDKLMKILGNLSMNTPKCLKPCSRVFDPVCISNGKYRTLIPNSCIRDIVNCVVGKKEAFKVIAKRDC